VIPNPKPCVGVASHPAGAAPLARAGLVARAAIVTTVGVFGFAYSLSAALIALALARGGHNETFIGLNAGMHALGVLLIAPVLPALTARFGGRNLVVLALTGTAAVLVLFGLLPYVWLWFPLRLALGVFAEVLFVLSETWLNQLSTEADRGRAMATYASVLSLGFVGGPLLLSVVGTEGMLPFVAGAFVSVLAIAFVMLPSVPALKVEAPSSSNPWRFLHLAPVTLASTALNAAVETAGLTFLPLYAVAAGWQEGEAPRLLAALMAGAIVLQLPIGWLADKVDRRRMLLGLAVMAGLGALAWPFVLHPAWLAYGVLFLWGGVFVGIYTIVLTVVGSRYQGADLIGIYAVSGLMWGVGALVGPMMVGLLSGATLHALPLVAAFGCLAFAAFARLSGRST